MQDLDKFKNEMNLSGQNVYVGYRYVPKIMGDWDSTQIYEPLSIVQYQGNSFTSRQFVPSGVELTNEEYWASTGNYNAQIEQYRQDVVNLGNNINTVSGEVINARNGEENLSVRLDKDFNNINGELITARNGEENLSVRLDNDLNSTTNKLNSRTQITPDDFEGNDFQKIQLALDYAIDNNTGIVFKRNFDITGEGTLNIKKAGNIRQPIQLFGVGGGIIKSDEGFMFSSDQTYTGDIYTYGLKFISSNGVGTTVFDGDKIIRVFDTASSFRNVDCVVKAEKYIQSYHFNNTSIIQGRGSAIKAPAMFAMKFTNILVEHRENFLEQSLASVGAENKSLYDVSVSDSTIEGLDGFAFKLRTTEVLNLNNIYFEANAGGDVVTDTDSYLAMVNINNVFTNNGSEIQTALLKVKCAYENVTVSNVSVLGDKHAVIDFTDAPSAVDSRVMVTNARKTTGDKYINAGIRIVENNSNFKPIIETIDDTKIGKTNLGLFTRLSATKQGSAAANSNGSLVINFGENLNNDSVIDIKTNNVSGFSDDTVVSGYSVSGTVLTIRFKNFSSTLGANIIFRVTVLKSAATYTG